MPKKVPETVESPLQLSAELEALLDDADQFAEDDLAERTREAYTSHNRRFLLWCKEHKVSGVPASPQALRGFLVYRAQRGLKVKTLAMDLAAIVHHHRSCGYADPTTHPAVVRTWMGLCKKLGTAQTKKAAITVEVLRKMLVELPEGLVGVRDRALLTLGFAGGFRRSELVGLDVSGLKFVRGGMEVTLVRSKTDQTAAGHLKEIANGQDPDTCPVRAMREWLRLGKVQDGPIFRAVNKHGHVSPTRLTGQSVRFVMKRALNVAGIPGDDFSPHSLRVGFVTTAKERGIDDGSIMKVTGHKSLQTMHGYDRRVQRWKDPATAKLGL